MTRVWLRVVQAKRCGIQKTLDVSGGNGSLYGNPWNSWWVGKASSLLSLAANHGDSLKDTWKSCKRTGKRAATGKDRTRDLPPTQHARAHLLALASDFLNWVQTRIKSNKVTFKQKKVHKTRVVLLCVRWNMELTKMLHFMEEFETNA